MLTLTALTILVSMTGEARGNAAAQSVAGLMVDLAAGAVPGPGVTGDACAFSSVGGVPNIATAGAVGFPPVAIPLVSCSFTVPRPGLLGLFVPFGPFAGVGDLARAKLPATSVRVTSSSAGGGTTADGVGQWTSVGRGPSALRATANVVVGPFPAPGGTAAGFAKDPFMLSAGTYSYAPEINELLLMASGQSIAAIGFDAESSLTTSGVLWNLGLVLTGNGILDIHFQSDPLLGLNDSLVDSNLLAALDRSTLGTVQLTSPYMLFSSTFTASQSFEHAEASRSFAQAEVPEPSTWLLLGSGIAGLAFWRRKVAA